MSVGKLSSFPLHGLFLYLWQQLLDFVLFFRNPSVHKFEFFAETNLPTDKGKSIFFPKLRGVFRVRSYRHSTLPGVEAIAVVYGKVENGKNIPVRVHDQCFTSEVLGSQKCDCKEQLDFAMTFIKSNGPGMVVYLNQEGRGIGLPNKIAAYALQEKGYDTVEANRLLGLPDDTRSYEAVADILEDLNISGVKLLTNNPRKIEELRKLGINVSSRIAVQMTANTHNVGYLRTKIEKMNHIMQTPSVATD